MMRRFFSLILFGAFLAIYSCKDEVTNGGITSCDFAALTEIADSCIVAIPNMFTPNSDGINDEFSIIFNNEGVSPVEDLHIIIQDEAANTIAEGFDMAFSWDGEASGGVNFGVYNVTVSLTIDSQPFTFESYVYCLPYDPSAQFVQIDCTDCLFATQWDGNSFEDGIDNNEDICE